jgi:hypothetical protein
MVEVRAVHYLLAVAAPGAAWTAGGRSQLPRGASIEVKIKNLVLKETVSGDGKKNFNQYFLYMRWWSLKFCVSLLLG